MSSHTPAQDMPGGSHTRPHLGSRQECGFEVVAQFSPHPSTFLPPSPASPSHSEPAALGWKPVGQTHWKPPSIFAACPLTPSMVTSLLLPPLVPPPWSFTLQGVPLNEPSVAPTCVSNSQSPSCGPQCLRLPSPAVISPFPPHLCLPAFPLHTLLLPHRVCCLLYIGQGHINTAFVACY